MLLHMDPVCRADGSGAQCFAAVGLVIVVFFALLGMHAIEQINASSTVLTQ